MNFNKKEKGFVITVDSFISVSLILIFVLISFYYLSNVSLDSWNAVDARILAFDEAAVLEKSLAVENSIKLSSSELILASLNSTPSGYCFEATVYDSTLSTPLVHAIKTGCTKNSTNLTSVERAIAVKQGSIVTFYILKVVVWGGGA